MLAAGLIAAATPALACSPVRNAEAKTEVLENCAVRHGRMPTGGEGLLEAENLWLGYVGQVFYEGDACGVREAQIVVDCANGTAFLFGPKGVMDSERHKAEMDGPYGELMRSIRRMPWGYEEVRDWDRLGDMRIVDLGSTLNGPVVLGDAEQAYDLTCACKLFNPRSEGADG